MTCVVTEIPQLSFSSFFFLFFMFVFDLSRFFFSFNSKKQWERKGKTPQHFMMQASSHFIERGLGLNLVHVNDKAGALYRCARSHFHFICLFYQSTAQLWRMAVLRIEHVI